MTLCFARRTVILPLVPFRGLDLLDQAYLLFLEALMTIRNGLLYPSCRPSPLRSSQISKPHSADRPLSPFLVAKIYLERANKTILQRRYFATMSRTRMMLTCLRQVFEIWKIYGGVPFRYKIPGLGPCSVGFLYTQSLIVGRRFRLFV